MKIPKNLRSLYSDEIKAIRWSILLLIIFSLVILSLIVLALVELISLFNLLLVPVFAYLTIYEFGRLRIHQSCLALKRYLFEPEYAKDFFEDDDNEQISGEHHN
ncbi:MAG: hypothetical protein ACK45H_01660 [Bacteroidota bacterium]|jgi:hypothetical protein